MAEGDGQEVAWLDDLVDEVRRIHELVLRLSGGTAGEHTVLLYSACARPFQSVLGEPAYSTILEQGAALFHALVCGHTFADGNKRTAILATVLYLSGNGYLKRPSDLQVRLLGELAVEAAAERLLVEDVADWLARILGPR